MKGNVSKIIRYIYWTIVIILLLAFLLIQTFHVDEYNLINGEIEIINEVTLCKKDGDQILVGNGKSFFYPDAKENECITIVAPLPEIDKNGMCVAVASNEQDIWIFVGNELRNSYDDSRYRVLVNYSASNVVMATLDKEDSGKEIKVIYRTPLAGYSKQLSCPVIGTEKNIVMWLLKNNISQAIGAVLLFAIGIVFTVFGTIMRLNKRNDKGLIYLGVYSGLIAIWLLCMSNLKIFYFQHTSSADLMTYLTLMLCPAPILMFFNTLMKHKYQLAYDVMIGISIVNFLINILLQIFGIVNVLEIMVTTRVTVLGTCMVALVTFILYDKKDEMADARAIGTGLVGLITATIIEDVNIYIHNYFLVGKYLGLGLLFFMLMLGYAAIKSMVIQEQDYQEAIHASMEKSNFLANMSHEIRTPINTILGMDEMILRENKDTDIAHYANNIRIAGNTLLSIINDILDFTKMESGKMKLTNKRYNVVTLLNELIESVSIRLEEKGLDLLLDIDEDVPSVLFGDDFKIKQAITNVLINAVKYTKYGSITLKVAYQKKSIDETEIIFTVSDTGIGIKEEDKDKIFSSFVRLEEKRNRSIEGTGLGMAITKQIVDIMCGNIDIESEYGKGTTVRISLLQKVLDEEPIGRFEKWYRTGHRKTKTYVEQYISNAKLLVVDDNEMNLEVIKGLLKKTGAVIEIAESGKQCLRLFQKEKYDLIFLDHMMPDMDGVETLKQLEKIMEKEGKKTPVIALTANAVSGAREEYISYGFADYISKPVEYKTLIDVMKKFLPDKIQTRAYIKTREDELAEYLEKNGIHMKKALKYAGGDLHQYIHLLELFSSERYYEKKKNLYEAFRRQIWKDYIIYVHGLKNNARTVGIDKLADMAYAHECMCKEGHYIFVQDHYEELVYEWSENVRIIREYLQKQKKMEQDEGGIHSVSSTEIEEKIVQLSKYISAFKKKEALNAVEEIMQYTKSDAEKYGKWQKIKTALEAYDYELAESMLKDN